MSGTDVKPIPGECPYPEELGNAGWTILHSSAAVFPNRPSPEQQLGMRHLIEGFASAYACSHCAYHLRLALRKHPVVTTNKRETSRYVCQLHNKVNKMLEKDQYDCDPNIVLRRWHPTYPDVDTDTPTVEEQLAAAAEEEKKKTLSDSNASRASSSGSSASSSLGGGGAWRWSRPSSDGDGDNTSVDMGSTQGHSTGPLSFGWGRASGTPSENNGDSADVSSLMQKVKACMVYCPEKKSPSAGGSS